MSKSSVKGYNELFFFCHFLFIYTIFIAFWPFVLMNILFINYIYKNIYILFMLKFEIKGANPKLNF